MINQGFSIFYVLPNENSLIYPHLLGGPQLFASFTVISKKKKTKKGIQSGKPPTSTLLGAISIKKRSLMLFCGSFTKFRRFDRLAINFRSFPLFGQRKYGKLLFHVLEPNTGRLCSLKQPQFSH